MSNLEYRVINSVLADKDLNVLMTPNSDELFTICPDIWQSIKNYYSKYRSIPSLEIIQERFTDLPTINTTGDPQHYMDELREEHIKNKMSNIMTNYNKALANDSGAKLLGELQFELSKLNRYTNASRELNIMDFEEAERHYEEVAKRAAEMGGTPGIPTGINFIDSAYTSGFAPGDLIIVLGWTGRGKSLLTTLFACNAYERGRKPMIVSLEMGPEKVRDRIYTIMGRGTFRNSSLSLGDINIDDFRSWSSKHDRGEFVVMSGNGLNEITPNVMQAKIEEHRPSMLVFDYAQLGSDNAGSGDMTHRMRNMSKEYKQLGVANEIPVVLISSATPDSSTAADSPPIIEQVAWSKQLAYDADLAFAVHKHNQSNIIEVVCRKNRNGELFDGYIEWDIDRGIWTERFEL